MSDHKNKGTQLALKMVKFNEKYLTQARIEIKILKSVRDKDPNSSKNCIDLKDYFVFRGRVVNFLLFSACSFHFYQ